MSSCIDEAQVEVGEEGASTKMIGGGQFANVIIENLLKAGVQNTVKNERLKFDRLDVHPGVWIHAEGEYTEKSGDVRRVGLCIGPEHGTVGPTLVKEGPRRRCRGSDSICCWCAGSRSIRTSRRRPSGMAS